MHRTDMKHDQTASQNPSHSFVLVTHTLLNTHTHTHTHELCIYLLEKQSHPGHGQAVEPG